MTKASPKDMGVLLNSLSIDALDKKIIALENKVADQAKLIDILFEKLIEKKRKKRNKERLVVGTKNDQNSKTIIV